MSLFIPGTSVARAEEPLAAVSAEARECGVFPDSIDQVRLAVSQGNLSEEQGASLLRPLINACSESLPLAPFEERLAEGLAKHVMPQRIVLALNKKLDEYRFATGLVSAVGKDVDPRLLVTVGEGIARGAKRVDLETYFIDFTGKDPAMFLTGAEMTAFLSQVDFSYELTRPALKAGFDNATLSPQWRYFVRLVLVARKRGLSDAEIARAARAALSDSGELGEVSARLGFTGRDLTGRRLSN